MVSQTIDTRLTGTINIPNEYSRRQKNSFDKYLSQNTIARCGDGGISRSIKGVSVKMEGDETETF